MSDYSNRPFGKPHEVAWREDAIIESQKADARLHERWAVQDAARRGPNSVSSTFPTQPSRDIEDSTIDAMIAQDQRAIASRERYEAGKQGFVITADGSKIPEEISVKDFDGKPLGVKLVWAGDSAAMPGPVLITLDEKTQD